MYTQIWISGARITYNRGLTLGNKTLGMSGFDTMSSETDLGPNLSPKTNL